MLVKCIDFDGHSNIFQHQKIFFEYCSISRNLFVPLQSYIRHTKCNLSPKAVIIT